MLLDILSGTALPGEYAFVVLCLAAAWMAGRSVANDWKPAWNLVVVSLLLGAGSRFLHFVGTHRFAGGVYGARSRRVLDRLPRRR